MQYNASADEQTLIDFWDRTFARSLADRLPADQQAPGNWKDHAPSEELFLAASALGRKKKVLDYGCGSAWAAVIAAKNGCRDVTAVDPAEGAVASALSSISLYGVGEQVHAFRISPDWLSTVPDSVYDGIICSNVLDVVPPDTAQEIIRHTARIAAEDADVFIGLNYYLSPEAAQSRHLSLSDGNRLYMDGVLRLVSRTDEEWLSLFAPCFRVESLRCFAWSGESEARRRLFHLRKKTDP